MRVTIRIVEEDIDYDDNPASKGEGESEGGEGEESTSSENAPLKVEDLLKKLVDAIEALKDAPS